jgi:hypothetical protein
MNKLLTPLQNYWDIIQPIIHRNLAPIDYFEFGEEGCKFKKNGKIYEVKIKEVK